MVLGLEQHPAPSLLAASLSFPPLYSCDSTDILQFLQLLGEHKKKEANDSQSGDLHTTTDADTFTDTDA